MYESWTWICKLTKIFNQVYRPIKFKNRRYHLCGLACKYIEKAEHDTKIPDVDNQPHTSSSSSASTASQLMIGVERGVSLFPSFALLLMWKTLPLSPEYLNVIGFLMAQQMPIPRRVADAAVAPPSATSNSSTTTVVIPFGVVLVSALQEVNWRLDWQSRPLFYLIITDRLISFSFNSRNLFFCPAWRIVAEVHRRTTIK